MTIDGGALPGRWRTQSPDDVVLLRRKICPMPHARVSPNLHHMRVRSARSTAPFLSTGRSRQGTGEIALQQGAVIAAVHLRTRNPQRCVIQSSHNYRRQYATLLRTHIPSVAPPRRGGLLSLKREFGYCGGMGNWTPAEL